MRLALSPHPALTCRQEVPQVHPIPKVARKEHPEGVGPEEGKVNLPQK